MSGSTYLLVPGAGGVAAYWLPVVAELERRGRDAIAVDLPGDDDSAGLPEYVEEIVRAAGDHDGLVVVTQSMGAFSGSLAAAQLPVSLLVLVNPMIPAPGETPGEWWANTGQPDAKRDNDIREGRDPDADFDLATYFLHDTPPELVDEVWSTSRVESDAAFGTPWTLSRWPAVPTRVISGADDRFFPLDFQRRLARDRLGAEPDVLPGGHLVALSHPVELVDLLESYGIVSGKPVVNKG